MASSSSFSPLAPASSSHSWKYDVFLSFRGEDTRLTFIDHLYDALVQQGINAYKDDEALHQGEEIRPSLKKAIEDSHIALIVFSENYASSSWCLDELAHIMNCRVTRGQVVMPIFYGVDPSHVRKQKRKYEEAFEKHNVENQDKVISWRKALVDASNLSGLEPKNISSGHESKVIKKIVENILRLQPVTSSASEKLVGMEGRVQGLESRLEIETRGVRMVGLWGVGGGGKTTLATSIYDAIYSSFDSCCFVANISKECKESSKRGLDNLEKEILSKMGGNNIGGGRSLISRRFCRRKVLIVLDDVDRLDQLEALVGSPNWFGEGSRIIITTRDKHLLNAHKVVVHDICLLNNVEAIELFRKHAPCGSGRMEDYEQLSKEVVSYAGGLPLALKVLGCFLCDKNIQQWESALARLKEIPHDDIVGKLRISFDGLNKVQKDLFLDIACFYRGWKKEWPMERLYACGFHPVIGVEELRQKALITISETGYFDMHDLVQEMGRYIVRGEHPNNPAKHTRVWKDEDILKICAMDASTELDKIEAIHVYQDLFSRQNISPIVANIKNLRYIEWEGGKELPDNFQPRQLCCLVLYGGLQKQLWNGYKSMPNLKMMELWCLENLIMTPNFDGLPNLERFKLYACHKLEEIHSSFGCLERLVYVNIFACPSIKKFPSVARLKKLEVIELTGCPRVFEISKIQQELENLLHDLYLNDSGEREVNKSQEDLIDVHNNINHIRLPNLRKLDLSNCNLGDEYMSSAAWDLPNLQQLNLSVNNFSRLSLLQIPQLKWLNVSHCYSLVELLELPSSTAVVIGDWCTSLKTFGDISNCKCMWEVSLLGVKKVGPLAGKMLLDSMLKRNAFGDHHLSMTLEHRMISKRFRGCEFTLRLPDDWYHDFCGFLIQVVAHNGFPAIEIIMKEDVDDDPPFEIWQEEDDKHDATRTCVGYVSFSSLRRTNCFNSTYNAISFSLRPYEAGAWDRLGAALVPKIRKEDPMKTTQVITNSEYWDEEIDYGQTFEIHQDSNSSTKILWRPLK